MVEQEIINLFLGGAIASIILASLMILIFLIIAIYIYSSVAWMMIARKMKFKNAWLAWIPFASGAMRLYLGGFHWAWIFLILIPIFGWIALIVLITIATWRIFEKLKYPGWISLSYPALYVPRLNAIGLIAYLVVIGFVAFKDNK